MFIRVLEYGKYVHVPVLNRHGPRFILKKKIPGCISISTNYSGNVILNSCLHSLMVPSFPFSNHESESFVLI